MAKALGKLGARAALISDDPRSFRFGSECMNKAILAAAATALASCGTTMGDRAASGAMIGGGAGAVFGGVGVVPGAIVGAGVGVLTPSSKVDLGKPVWRD